MPEQTKKPFLSRPKDRTLEAYKAWMTEIINNISPDAKKTMTDEKWEKGWKKFWKSDNPLEEKEQQSSATDETSEKPLTP